MRKHLCEICKKPTDLQGWIFICKEGFSLRNFKKEYKYWCKEHFLQNMFNLWPFTCTVSCRKALEKKNDTVLDKVEDSYVWLNLITVLNSTIPFEKQKPGVSYPMRVNPPKCPHCGKKMKLAKAIKYS
jgi:hypothetical protein